MTWVVAFVVARALAFLFFRIASGFTGALVEQAWPPVLMMALMGACEGLIYGLAFVFGLGVRTKARLIPLTMGFFALGWVALSFLSPEEHESPLIFGGVFGALFGLGLGLVQQSIQRRLGRDFFVKSAIGWASAMLLSAIAREQTGAFECLIDCVLAGAALGFATLPGFDIDFFLEKDRKMSISKEPQS